MNKTPAETFVVLAAILGHAATIPTFGQAFTRAEFDWNGDISLQVSGTEDADVGDRLAGLLGLSEVSRTSQPSRLGGLPPETAHRAVWEGRYGDNQVRVNMIRFTPLSDDGDSPCDAGSGE